MTLPVGAEGPGAPHGLCVCCGLTPGRAARAVQCPPSSQPTLSGWIVATRAYTGARLRSDLTSAPWHWFPGDLLYPGDIWSRLLWARTAAPESPSPWALAVMEDWAGTWTVLQAFLGALGYGFGKESMVKCPVTGLCQRGCPQMLTSVT